MIYFAPAQKEKMLPFWKEGVCYLIRRECEDEIVGDGGPHVLDPRLCPCYVYDALIHIVPGEVLLEVRPEAATGGRTC